MGVDPTVRRREIGTLTQKSWRTGGLVSIVSDCENRLWNRWIDLRHYTWQRRNLGCCLRTHKVVAADLAVARPCLQLCSPSEGLSLSLLCSLLCGGGVQSRIYFVEILPRPATPRRLLLLLHRYWQTSTWDSDIMSLVAIHLYIMHLYNIQLHV